MSKRINSANLIVKESIETALIELMKKKSIEDITISEIVEKAGVSRVSYYRNYYYKEDVLFSAMDKIAAQWKRNADEEEGEMGDKVVELFEMERPLLKIIYKNHLEHLMYKLIRKYCGLDEKIEINGIAYVLSFLAGGFYGWCDEWVRRGMQETPEQIKEMFKQMEEQKKTDNHNIQ